MVRAGACTRALTYCLLSVVHKGEGPGFAWAFDFVNGLLGGGGTIRSGASLKSHHVPALMSANAQRCCTSPCTGAAPHSQSSSQQESLHN